MTALSITLFHADQVRTVIIDGVIWFVAGDVAKILGYKSTKDMTRMLEESEKGTHIVPPLYSANTPRGGGAQEMTIISESGVYHAILKSRKSEAVAFRRWVTGTLLPKLAREGSYSLGVAPMPDRFFLIDRRDKALRAMAAAKSEGARELYWRSISAYCEALGESCPSIEAFGRPASADMIQMRRLWSIIQPALDAEILANHSRNADAGEIALHPTELLPFLAGQGFPLQRIRLLNLLRLSDNPRFVAAKNVNSVGGTIRRCCVFHPVVNVDAISLLSATEQPMLPFGEGGL